jgi:hypothetical protein
MCVQTCAVCADQKTVFNGGGEGFHLKNLDTNLYYVLFVVKLFRKLLSFKWCGQTDNATHFVGVIIQRQLGHVSALDKRTHRVDFCHHAQIFTAITLDQHKIANHDIGWGLGAWNEVSISLLECDLQNNQQKISES